jgi:NitT/TauT family transport system ATP-binding protein
LWTEEKQSVLFVTHDITEAVLLADRVIVFSPRPAKIVQDIAIPFSRPRSPDLSSTKEFLELSHTLLQILKRTPLSGQVRVSI